MNTLEQETSRQRVPMESDLTIVGVIQILQRRRWIIGACTATCLIVVALVCLFMTRQYAANGEIQVAKQSSDGLGLESLMGGAAESASDALDGNITLQTQANILSSDTLALRVINDLHLEEMKDFEPTFDPIGWVLGRLSPSGPPDPAHASLEDSPRRRVHLLKIFANHLTVKPVAGTRLIDITYTSSDPKTAAAVINQLTQALAEYTFQIRYTATNQASKWLTNQLDDVKAEAEKSQAKVAKLQIDSGVYSLGTADASGKEIAYSATLDRLQQATAAMTQATASRILKGGIYEMTKAGNPELISGLAGSSLASASPAVNNSFSLIQSLRTQQATLESQIATDRSKYGLENPKLADEQASLESVDTAIAREVARIGSRAENDYRAAQATERGMEDVYQRQREAADQLNNKAIEYTIAKQEAIESRELYETLFQHLKEAGVIEGLHSSNITIVDPGRTPAKPVKPNVPIYMGVALFGGLFLGSMGALFTDAIDDRIQSIDVLEQQLHVPILGVLPLIAPDGKGFSGLASLVPARRLLEGGGSAVARSRLVIVDEPSASFAEALRALRTALLLSRSGSPPKVILVTSAAESEGKTTISMNLAGVLAQNGSKVLLIEADMRRPGLSRRLGFQGKEGLSKLLAGKAEESEITVLADLSNLSALPAGPIPPYPSELLGSPRMRELLNGWSRDYDFVVLDSPPVLAVTDAAVLSKLADVTLLVARHTLSTRKSLERAYRTLRMDDSAKVSIVLNGVHRGSSSYSDYYGYSGTSYYGANKESANV